MLTGESNSASGAQLDRKLALANMHASIRRQALQVPTDQRHKFAGMLWRQQRFIQNLERTGMRRNVMAVGAAAGKQRLSSMPSLHIIGKYFFFAVVMFASQSLKGSENGSGLAVS